MDSYTKLDRQFERFRKVYPRGLPERLEWWGKTIGLDRAHLLRLIGMPAEEAKKARKKPLKEILKEEKYRDNAMLLQDGLHALLTLYQHDYHDLVERLRQAEFHEEPEPLDVLAERVARGGPDWLTNITSYLATALRNGAAPEES